MTNNMKQILPTISVDSVEVTLPYSGQVVEIRPFTGSDEKELLLAIHSENEKRQSKTLLNVVQKCVGTPNVLVNALTTVDFEYLFLKVYELSVNEHVDVQFVCQNKECSAKFNGKIPLGECQSESIDKSILTVEVRGLLVQLEYPSMETVSNKDLNNPEEVFNIAAQCVVSIKEGEVVYDNLDPKTVSAWFDAMPAKELTKILSVFNSIPTLTYTKTFACPTCGETSTIELRGLGSFFPSA